MTGPIFDTHAHYSARAFDADRFALLDSLPEKWRTATASPPIGLCAIRMRQTPPRSARRPAQATHTAPADRTRWTLPWRSD